MGRGLVVDGWLKLAGWARIGVLVTKLRGLVDDLIGQQVQKPGTDVRGSEVTRMVMRLIELNGLDV
jgi:ATP-dependent RNA helicase DHX57